MRLRHLTLPALNPACTITCFSAICSSNIQSNRMGKKSLNRTFLHSKLNNILEGKNTPCKHEIVPNSRKHHFPFINQSQSCGKGHVLDCSLEVQKNIEGRLHLCATVHKTILYNRYYHIQFTPFQTVTWKKPHTEPCLETINLSGGVEKPTMNTWDIINSSLCAIRRYSAFYPQIHIKCQHRNCIIPGAHELFFQWVH